MIVNHTVQNCIALGIATTYVFLLSYHCTFLERLIFLCFIC